jgi:hypothetical protein
VGQLRQGTSLTPGEKNVVSPLVILEKICLPLLHIKLGLMKNFVKGMDITGCEFKYVRNKFPNVSDAKIKEGMFIEPQVREMIQDKQFDEDLNETERNAWLSFKRILGNHKAVNYQDVVQDLLTLYKAIWMQYASENPLSGVTLGIFSQIISAKSVTNTVTRFHQDIMAMEKRYQGK